MINKKGVALAISTIVILVVVFLVLIIVVGFFLGGFNYLGGSVGEVGEGASNETTGILEKLRWVSGGMEEGICSGTPADTKNTCSEIYDDGVCSKLEEYGICPDGWSTSNNHCMPATTSLVQKCKNINDKNSCKYVKCTWS